MTKIAKGAAVRQIVKPIEGVVESFAIDQETGARQFKVVWSDADGNECSRYFAEGEIEAVERPEA